MQPRRRAGQLQLTAGAANFASDADYSVTVKGTDDAAPVANTAQITRTFHVDRTAPVVAVTRPAEDSIQPPAFTPGFTVTEANPADAGAATCSRDGGAFGACGAVSGLANGHHTFAVRAVDKAGNATTATHGFDVDGTPPEVEITDGPAENEIIRTSGVQFTFAASDPSAPLTRSCRIDGGFGACTSGTTHAASGLSEGAHVFEVRATDAAGNTTTVTRNFVVNALRPTVEITGGPGEGAVIKATEATFLFSTSGVPSSARSTPRRRSADCTAPTRTGSPASSDGGHTFRVRVRDASNDEVDQGRARSRSTPRQPPPPETLIIEILNPTLSTRSSPRNTTRSPASRTTRASW